MKSNYHAKFILIAASLFLFISNPVSAQNKRGIRSVDFRNFAYDSKQSIDKIVLKDGRKVIEELPGLYAKDFLISVKYVDFDRDGKEEAAVRLRSTTNGSMVYSEEYYVFAYRNKKVEKLFHEWREKPKSTRVQGRSIIIVAPFWTDADAHCCPSYIETISYRWQRSQFIVVSRQLRKDRYPN
jgi:hypothetical protein